MRDIFPEWYSLDQPTIESILIEGTIVLDANVLLDLYRLGDGQRDQILKLLSREGVCDRLWIPYQVALEYQRNRVKVAAGHVKQYDDISGVTEKFVKTISGEIEKLRDKSVRAALDDSLEQLLAPALDQMVSAISVLKDQNVIMLKHENSKDALRDSIDALFGGGGKVGPKPDASVIEDRMKLVDGRYANSIPPGYKDANKSDNREGDLLAWFELLEYMGSSSRPMLFVTSDVKEDWYERVGGHTAGPRKELRVEMLSVSSHPYHQVPLERFLTLANIHLSADVQEETIRTVDELNRQRETESQILSKIRHPANRAVFDEALARFRTGTAANQHLRRALAMADGSLPYDSSSAEAALRILDSFASTEERNDEIRRSLAAGEKSLIKAHNHESASDAASEIAAKLLELASRNPDLAVQFKERFSRIFGREDWMDYLIREDLNLPSDIDVNNNFDGDSF